MILFLISLLKQTYGWHIPAAFSYCSTRMALGAIFSLVFTIFLGKPVLRKLYQWKVGEVIRKEECPLLGELHRAKKDTPTMGGVLILCALCLSLFLFMDLSSSFTWILLLTTLFLGCVGATDDFFKLKKQSKKGISARQKSAAQIVFASLLALYLLYPPFSESIQSAFSLSPPRAYPQVEQSVNSWGPVKKTEDTRSLSSQYVARLYIPFVKNPWVLSSKGLLFLFGVFIVAVIVGSSNAVNLADGLDGLAAGSVLMVSSSLALIAFISNNVDLARYLQILSIEGSGEIAVFLSSVSGACLGFLWYNAHPAQVFMGDTGSLALGGILGVCSVLLCRTLLLALVGGIFVAEALSVMLQVGSYKLFKKRVFLCAPLHHHFEYQGWSEPKVVVRFWIIGLLLAVLGILSLKIQ